MRHDLRDGWCPAVRHIQLHIVGQRGASVVA